MVNKARVVKLIQSLAARGGPFCLHSISILLLLTILSACVRSVVPPTPKPPENHAPNIPSSITCPASPLPGSSNNACTLAAASPTDPDGNAVTYLDGGSSCASVVVNSTTGNATFKAPVNGLTCLVKVIAFDGAKYSSAISSVTIMGVNSSPNTPTTLSCVTSPVAGSLNNTCTLTAASPTDIDGDTVSYVNGGSTCAGISVSVLTGGVTFTAPAKGATCQVIVKAFDGATYSSAISSATITGTNNAPNTPAALTCVTSPGAGSLNNACTLTATSPADPDGDAVTYSNVGSTCTSVVVNSSTGNATFTAPAKGLTCLVKVKAFDSVLYSSAISSATITGANNAPNTPTSLACVTSPLGGSTSNACTLTAASPTDIDGDTVSYVDGGSTCVGISVSVLTGGVTFTAPAKGLTCLVKVKAFDSVLYSGAISSATITGANNAPNTPTTLTCVTSPVAGSTSNACTLTAASPTDPDGDTVSYVVDGASTCTSIVVTSSTGNTTFKAPAKGATCLVKVKAYDSALYSSAISSATITGANNAPTTPTSISCPASPVAGSTGIACTLTAASPTDPDGDTISYLDGGSTCSSTVVNSSTGGVTFTAPALSATCIVKIKSYDSSMYSSVVSSSTITGSAAANGINITYSNIANPYYNKNIFLDAKTAGWNGSSAVTINVTISSGVSIGSSTPANPALITNDPTATPAQLFPAGTVINITNNGTIEGAGGNGGSCAGGGGAGGNALEISYPATLNNLGNIWGGGGGGGAGGDDHNECPNGYGYGGQGAGIGGASPTGGAPGVDGGYLYHDDPGSCNVANGGSGGSPGSSGAGGDDANEGGSAGGGGAAGWAIIGTEAILNSDWFSSGTYLGNDSSQATVASYTQSPGRITTIISGGNQPEGAKGRILSQLVVQFSVAGAILVKDLPVSWVSINGVLSNCQPITDSYGETACTLTTGRAVTTVATVQAGNSILTFSTKSYSICNGTSTLAVGATCTGSYAGLKYAGDFNGHEYITTAADSGTAVWSPASDATGATDANDGAFNQQRLKTYYGVNFATKTPAANVCNSLGAAWFLPSANENNFLYQNKTAIGGFASSYYWSSTEYPNPIYAYYNNWGYSSMNTKISSYSVRCVLKD